MIEALRAAVRGTPAVDLAVQLDAGADEIAHLVPEVRRLLAPPRDPDEAAVPDGRAASASPADAAQARFRLFDAVTMFLTARSAARPQVVILDDLHWADSSSLLLLQVLARTVQGARLLVVGAYRDVEVADDHPLAGAIAALSRERGCRHVALRGVSPDATATLLAGTNGAATAPPSFTHALHDLTAGNPLFIREMLRHLVESGRLAEVSTASAARLPAALGVPEGVRGVLRQRLARLSPEASHVLSVAAVVGREFDVATLTSVFEAQGQPVMEALDEAEAARLVAALPGAGAAIALRYRFTHDLIRETLEAGLSRRARMQLHHQVGEALEDRWRANIAAHVSELAYHAVQAAPAAVAPRPLRLALGRPAAPLPSPRPPLHLACGRLAAPHRNLPAPT